MNVSWVRTFLATVLVMALASATRAATLEEEMDSLQRDWAVENYEASGAERLKGFETLAQRAAALSAEYSNRAEPLVWEGIILSTYAGVKGGIGALGIAKKARAKLEAALRIDPRALNGSAYTSLGTLYYKAPGFPIGFGDRNKASWYLHKALEVNPDGIDTNYFYAEYLFEEGKHEQAREHLERALRAPARRGRELADHGRRREINALLAKVISKMS